jgi:hypothetical protein
MAKSSKDKDGKSALEAALRAYEAGDMVGARRTARKVIAGATSEDQAAAKRVAKALHGDDDKGEAQAELLAGEIVKRGSPILRPYLWFIGGVTAYALLLTLALVRYG